MRVYRNEYSSHFGESEGFDFFTSAKAAKKAAADFRAERIDEEGVEVETTFQIVPRLTKGGLLRILRAWASHADNG